ncbi:MAG: aminotransferase class I/II-fold pyridoxal phosphate-dependent enzyme [Streptosporangiales bacterium]|nr:aminotransferase class I/II-fold pyridoxal phosphate-dependent enzyme [Streptosporangiales bacterium]
MATPSATLAANERVKERIAAGHDVLHLAFGEAGLPVHPAVADVLAGAVSRSGYPPVAGEPAARSACAGYFRRRGLTAGPEQVLLAPGSKALLYAVLAAVPGDVVLPRPSWVSYAAQAALAGKSVIDVPIPEHVGGVPEPRALDDALRAAVAAGRRPGSLVLTIPDNPTGTVADVATLQAVCEIAARHALLVISDEIYADLLHPSAAGPASYPSGPATLLPDRTVVTTGLSKRLALGGWRIGVALLPDSAVGRSVYSRLVAIASEIWSALPGPMQAVAEYAFSEPVELRDHVAASQRLHGAVARAMHGVFVEAGAACRPPGGAFYLYPDLEPHRPRLSHSGISAGQDLAEALLDRYDIGVLPGVAFGDHGDRLTFRVATSLLYGGTDEQRRTALESPNPTRLPWIAAAIDRTCESLSDLLLTS